MWGLLPRAERHWGGDGSVVSTPLMALGSTPLYLCLPLFRGSVGSDHYFYITGGTYKEMTSAKVHLKQRDTWQIGCTVQPRVQFVSHPYAFRCSRFYSFSLLRREYINSVHPTLRVFYTHNATHRLTARTVIARTCNSVRVFCKIEWWHVC